MIGWTIPPPSATKSEEQLRLERERKVTNLVSSGLLHSERLRRAMLVVRREQFVPAAYRDHAYEEVPVRLPGREATISCPHSYPLFYEAVGLDEGHRFLEVGLGSGYGAALAREVVGRTGLVVSVEIDPDTFGYGDANLDRAGYTDVVRVLGDGSVGYATYAPYDRICVTAACSTVPTPLVDQLNTNGKLVVPLERAAHQELTLLEKTAEGVRTTRICDVLYVPLQSASGRQRRDATGARPALIVTCRSFGGRHPTRSAVRRALPEAHVRGTGFRDVLRVDSAGDPLSLAELLTGTGEESLGRVTAVLAEVPSERVALLEAATRVGLDQIAPGESFAFRIHKRGTHGYSEPTPELESTVGGAIWDGLERRDGLAPHVDLSQPDVLVNAEVLGPTTLVGIVRAGWKGRVQARAV